MLHDKSTADLADASNNAYRRCIYIYNEIFVVETGADNGNMNLGRGGSRKTMYCLADILFLSLYVDIRNSKCFNPSKILVYTLILEFVDRE